VLAKKNKQLISNNSHFSNVNGDVMQPPLPLAGLNILVVDDDDDTRFYITTVLEADGATVMAVASAAAARQVLPELQPDLLICDIAMPGEDGYTLIRKIRALKPDIGGQVLAIALTAYGDTEDRIRALEAGFQTHVAKPIDPEELVAIVVSLVASCNW
jgi:CheY-like chemotaxis protein